MKKISRVELKVGKEIQPTGFPLGRITTIEYCSLESFIDGRKKKRWPCWTVRTKAPRPLHKYLIVDWGKDGIILWKKSKLEFAPKGAKLWVGRSGLEEMENITGSGPESYVYSMLVYILDPKAKSPSRFFCIERLRNNRIFRYQGFRISE
ncbi:MAG: hypothetical protein PHS57_01120 [Alphaproteobacteria bacterium]|nr:hypothetical protein [Alphaproteobacteria bacterium]